MLCRLRERLVTYRDELNGLRGRTGNLLGANADLSAAVRRMEQVSYQPGALSGREKELIGLLLGIVLHCEDCLVYHTMRCINAGVTREQFVEGLAICAQMGGGPALAFSTKALAAFDELSNRSAA